MSLDTTISGWLEELEHSEAAIKPYLESLREDTLAFTGKSYRAGHGRNAPENHALEWFSLMRGQLLMGNPAVRWTSMLDGDAQARAHALTMATNMVSKRLMFRNVNEQLLMDFGFKWAVALVKNSPAPGFEDIRGTPKWPAVYRISPRQFRYDTAATRADARAWSAHLVIGSRKKLMELAKDEDSGWNRDALETLERQNVTKFRDKENKIPERDEIAYWEIWCPGEELDKSPGAKKGYNGTIYTVADNQGYQIGWIRDPYPAFVPPWGPYVVGGDYVVPDESAHMGPLTASSQQANYLNRIKRATARAVENYKNLVIVRNGGNLPDLIKTGDDQFVYSIDDKDPASAVVQLQVGGATQQHFAAQEDAQGTLDKVSGITDIMRGQVDPRNKATQDALAAQSSAGRTSGTVSKFYDLVTRYLYTVGYFIDIDDEIEIELGPQAVGKFVDAKGQPTTKLKGGHHKNQDPEEFFQLDLDLKVGSMERTLENDAQMQMMLIDQTIGQIATLGLQTAAFVDWDTILEAKAELSGIQILKRIVDVQGMKQMAAAMMQMQAQQGSSAGGGVQPAGSGKPQLQYAGNAKSAAPGAGLVERMAAKGASGPQTANKAGKALTAKGPSLDSGSKAK